MKHEGDGDTSCNWCTRNGHRRFGKGAGRVGKRRMNCDYQSNNIVNIGRNTENTPGDSRELQLNTMS